LLETPPNDRSFRRVKVATDIWQQLENVEPSTIDRIVGRLEMRGSDDTFVGLTNQYLDLIDIDSLEMVLELGCGTGVISRSIATRPRFVGSVVGSDYSPQLIEAAKRLAAVDGVERRVRFEVENAQATRQPDNTYDAVILHTVVSHLPDPAAAIGEAVRVAKPSGVVVVFDGDYASLTIHTGHPEDDTALRAIRNVSSANHRVMRAMPGIMKEHSLSIREIDASVFAAAGESPFFSSLVATYVPLAVADGELDQGLADDWLGAFEASSAAGTAFASCNYLSYIAQPD
jgi:ubiquinone/menaquinone biosynthesis C-methylase UbiE